MDEMEIRTWAYDQARMTAQHQVSGTIEETALRIARFVQTGSFEEKAEVAAPKMW